MASDLLITSSRSMIILLFLVVCVVLAAGCAAGQQAGDRQSDEKTGVIHLTNKSLIGYEYPTIDGDHIAWTWVNDDPYRGITLYTISTKKYTEIKARPFGMSPPKISGDYIVWADTAECVLRNQTIGLVLYDISSGNKTCICNHPVSPRFAAISSNYVVWEDQKDINLYDIRTGKESVILPNSSYQELPSISGDNVVWSDYRNYNDGGYHKDYFLYNISTGSVMAINTVPEFHTASAPYIFQDRVLWSDTGKGMSSKVHLYNITTGQEQILDDNSSGVVGGFSMYGDLIVWTSAEFRGSDVPEHNSLLFDLKKGAVIPVCLTGSNHQSSASISGNTIIFQDGVGIGLCAITP
jgi:hypothetical protein